VALVDKYLEISNRYNEDIDSHESPLHVQNKRRRQSSRSLYADLEQTRSLGNINYHSSVTIIEYATSKVILPVDNDRESWQELLGARSLQRSH